MTFETPGPITANLDVVVATSGSPPASAPTPSSTCAPAIRPAKKTSRPPSRRASSSSRATCWSRRRSCARGLLRSHGGSVDVTVELPLRSTVVGAGRLTDFRTEGELGDLRIKTGIGRSARARRAAEPQTGAGEITVERATGDADINAGSGDCAWASSTAGGGEELQRRHLDRRAGGELRSTPPTATSPSSRRGPAVVAPRPPTATSGSARSRAARSCWRRGSASSRSASARAPPPGSTSAPVRRACTTRWTPPTRPTPAHRDRSRSGRARGHRRHRRSTEGADALRHRGHRPAQVLRRPGRARRRRPRRRRGHASSRCSARTARARRRPCSILSTLIRADAGERPRRRARRRPRPRRGARRDRRHRPVLGRRQPAHRRGEPAC